jgi:hypothetical protein
MQIYFIFKDRDWNKKLIGWQIISCWGDGVWETIICAHIV